MPLRRRRRLCSAVATAGAVALVAACHPAGGAPSPSTSSSTAVRPFTVVSTDVVRVTDPAPITDAASAMLSLNAFQRLMTAPPGQPVLKPDAAQDCLFTSTTVYTCTLKKELVFSNGHPLTSSDVKFSIQRATRLNVPGSSAWLLSSLRRIETPDPLTVRFVLSRFDSQFGWALATPAASIVDEDTYNADEVRPPTEPVVGSGPFTVTRFEHGEIELSRSPDYLGYNPARIKTLTYRTVPDSASIEEAMKKDQADVVWRGLDSAAVTRFAAQIKQSPDEQTADGFGLHTFTGLRVRELIWSPASRLREDTRLRQAIAVALQGDRTLDSIVPGGIPGHIAAFPAGGRAEPRVTWNNRIQLTLAYDPSAPDGRDLANQIRTRLEDTGGMSVRLRPDDAGADITLVDRKAWTATPLAWMQPYLESPLPASRTTVSALQTAYRETTDTKAAENVLAALQRQAAEDLTVLPVSQGDEQQFARRGVDVSATSFGPGWQLGLFGMADG